MEIVYEEGQYRFYKDGDEYKIYHVGFDGLHRMGKNEQFKTKKEAWNYYKERLIL